MIYYTVHTVCGAGTNGGWFVEASSGTPVCSPSAEPALLCFPS